MTARRCSTTTRATSSPGRCGPSMQTSDVTETLDLARAKTGVDRIRVVHRPRLLSDNGPCYVSAELATYLETHGLGAYAERAESPDDAGQDRAVSPVDEERGEAGEVLQPVGTRTRHRALRRRLPPPPAA